MTMVCGLDLHRRQITFDALEVETGKVWRGRVWQPDRERFRRWLRDDVAERAGGGPVSIAVEGCTGWRYVVEEVVAAGFEAHLAEPADTQAARGRKRRAKTDRSDCRLLRELLQDGRLPASWIAPTIVLEWRERARLYKTLVDQRSTWVQRIHAELYQHGVTFVVQVQVAAQEEASAGSNLTELRALLRRTGIPRAVTSQLLAAAAPLWTISEQPAVLAADLALCHPPLAAAEVRAVARPMDGDAFRLTVVAHDRTGLLADSAAAVADAGLSVHSASAATWTEQDLALHALTVVPVSGVAPDWDAVGERLRSAIVERARPPRFTPRGRATVSLAGAGPGPSIVRVTAPDQVGLLEAISRWFAEHGVGILAAEITTRGRAASDRFVVDGDFDHEALAAHLSGPHRPSLRLSRPAHRMLRSPA